MLDSNGINETQNVFCANCGRKIGFFITQTPKKGHAGEDLDVGGCIPRESIGALKECRMYKIQITDGRFFGERFHLGISMEPYHYGGYKIPEFGFLPDQVVCICKSASCENVFAPDAIRKKFYDEVSRLYMCAISQKDIELVFKEKSEEKNQMLSKTKSLLKILNLLNGTYNKSCVKTLDIIKEALEKLNQ